MRKWLKVSAFAGLLVVAAAGYIYSAASTRNETVIWNFVNGVKIAGVSLSQDGLTTLSNLDTIDDAVAGTFMFGRPTAGTVTISVKDDNANAALLVAPGGTGALTLGGASSGALRVNSGTNGTVLLGRTDAGTVTVTAADSDATAALSVLPGGAAALTLGGASATAIDLTTDGGTLTVDGPNVSTGTGGAFTIKRSDAGTVTVTAADDNATAAMTVTPGGAALLTLGGASATSIDMTTDGGTVTIDGSITTPAAGAITAATSLTLTAGTTGIIVMDANGVRRTPPATQTIGAGGTIAADSCGGVKNITAAGAVTTDTTDSITAPAAANTNCAMLVCNVGATNAITIDKNANILLQGGADVALLGNSCIGVVSNGTVWRQTTAQQTST